ncbi:MAG: hypothetical protein JST09_10190 [Bacteroidetes bacterium]|nr:hypothetical protein [Bacteroidota bacterium]MBS1607445.1 hypothetical protein [Bacteroidota bacterium]
MKGFENEIYYYLLMVSNLVALVMLFAAIKWPRVARLLFFLLFAWASWMNWTTVMEKPQVYLEYATFTWSALYRNFINGWFSQHIQLCVGFIATCQGLIALSMLLNKWIFRTGAIGAILFLMALIPFGLGSGFPTTLVMAIALIVILSKHADRVIWLPSRQIALA